MKNQKSCGGFLDDFTPKQKACWVILSAILIGVVTTCCIIATREPKKGMTLHGAGATGLPLQNSLCLSSGSGTPD